jgi:hypothetical protein
MRYQDYVDVFSKDLATRAQHLSWHPKEICEEERVALKERRKSVKRNDRITRP